MVEALSVQDKMLLVEASLERTAAALGDVTAPVMSRFYAAFPEARASFEHHGGGRRERLEADMVENALYFAMAWPERSLEIQCLLSTSVPHHQDTLDIPPVWYRGLMQAVVDVVLDLVPPEAGAERRVWEEIGGELGERIIASRSTFPPRRRMSGGSAVAEPDHGQIPEGLPTAQAAQA